jgi:hypothetical protein
MELEMYCSMMSQSKTCFQTDARKLERLQESIQYV